MFTSPYTTTLIARRYPHLEQLKSVIQRANVEAPFEKMKTPTGNIIRDAFIITPSSDYDDVPGFTQYITIPTRGRNPMYVLDARPYMRVERQSGTYRLVSHNDYTLQCVRLGLSIEADKNGLSRIATLGRVPAVTFIRLITHALTNTFQLSVENQIQVSIITAYYYLCLLNGGVIEEHEKPLFAQKIASYTSLLATNILDVLVELKPMQTINDLIDALRHNANSIRLNDITLENLYILIANSWIGVYSRENIGVALEHIPTWIALVYASIDEKSYKKTILAQRALTAGKQNDTKYFTDLTYRLVAEHFE